MAKREHMKDKTATELEKLLTDTRGQLRAARFASAGARAKDPNQAGKLRKVVARALTELHART